MILHQTLIGIAAGALVGAAFLGSLWLTAEKVTASAPDRGAVLFVVTALLRVALVAAAFVMLARFAGPVALAAALVAFVTVRTVAVTRTRAVLAAHESAREG